MQGARRPIAGRFVGRAIVVLFALTAGGCTEPGKEADEQPGPTSITSLVETRPTVPNESAPDWVGAVVNLHDLAAGDCFNQYSWSNDERVIEIDTKVDCAGPHQKEIYLRAEHPARAGAPWPGDREVDAFASAECYGAFSDFVDEIYELSELELGFLTPSRTNFEDDVARFRGVHCYVHLGGDAELVGTARGSKR